MQVEIAEDADWETIASKLPANWRALAREHGLLIADEGRDATGGSGWKIRDEAALLRMILHYVTTGASLRTTTALAAALGLATISAAAFHKWIRKCGPWLAAMLAGMVAAATTFAAERWAGYLVIAVDATTAQMPGATTSTARVHYALRLTDLVAVAIHVTTAKVGETLRRFAMAAGQLWIADRGYSNANSVAHATAAGAAVLVRFAFGPLPLFDAAGAPFDARARVRGVTTVGAVGEWAVWVHPNTGPTLTGRLLAVRLSDEQAAKAVARLYREHKKSDVSAEMREFAHYVVLFTTVPAARLTAAQLVELYRLRWSVELEFKRDKSIGGLGDLPNRLPETIHSWICAKMLALQLAQRLAEPGEPFPPSIVGAYALQLRVSQIVALAQSHRA